MVIRELYLDHFGKFNNTVISLKPGINIVYGSNESGKSTVHSFIRCMLFGAQRTRGRGAGKDMYSRYEPWDGGGYSGRLRFEYAGRIWRIVRDFDRDPSAFALIDEQAGREYELEGDQISALIDGLTLSAYNNTVSCSQLSGGPDDGFCADMQTYMANMAAGADSSADVSAALEYLKAERKKASGSISADDYRNMCDKADDLRKKIAENGQAMQVQAEAEKEKEELSRKIRHLETVADNAVRGDRQDRMRAISLIQENNDITAMYREKTEQLKKLESESGYEGKDRKRLQKTLEEYEKTQDRIDDIRSRIDEQKEGRSGSGTAAGIAVCLPFLAAALLVCIFGENLGLDVTERAFAGIALAAAGAAAGIIVRLVRGGTKRRINKLLEEEEELEDEQSDLLDRCGISDIGQLRDKLKSRANREELEKHLREEIDDLHERYDKLQGPLAPYIEKYGESVSPESDAGQEEKQKIEQLRRQVGELNRRIDQAGWQAEQVRGWQTELDEAEEAISRYKSDRKARDDEVEAIDLSMNVIREITADIHDRMGNRLSDNVSDLFGRITDNSGRRLTISEKFEIQADDGHRLIKPWQLSAGTSDQIYFSVRMASAGLLFKEPVPLILDDSFALYDDDRLENVLRWLSEQNDLCQIIIFTCHHRESEILDRTGTPYCLTQL